MSGVFGHPWLGGLFDDDEAAAIWSARAQLGHMLAFEAAFTRALGATGKIPADLSEDVAARIGGFAPDLEDLRRGTARDGLPVPALVAQLRAIVPECPEAVHSGATSQDVLDTALSLTLARFNPLLLHRLDALSKALGALSRRFGDNALTGRTRMQAALPIRVADRLRAWQQPLGAHVARLEALRPQVELLQLGGAVGDRAALQPGAGAIAADLAARLGLGDPPAAWHTNRAALADYAGLLSLVSGTLGKLGQDICLMAQQGLDDYALEGGGGSSAMPHKQNPVLAETLVSLARFNATQLSGIHHALVHEQERSGAAWTLEWMILPDMALACARALGLGLAICAQTTRIGHPPQS